MKIFIIAEAGSVHDGSFGNAKNLCKLAKKCGANAVKFQLHFSEEETLRNAPSPKHFKSENRFKYFERTSFTFEQWKKLKNYCKKIKIDFFVSIFSEKALEFVKKLKLKYVKIPSGEVTNLPLLKKISQTKLKVILSTGMSNFAEIDEAIKILGKKTILMQCTSEYPTQNKRVGLNVITDFLKRYKGIQTGFSDHTNLIAPAIGAIMLGSKYIEKQNYDSVCILEIGTARGFSSLCMAGLHFGFTLSLWVHFLEGQTGISMDLLNIGMHIN